jgi:hypothetical protein
LIGDQHSVKTNFKIRRDTKLGKVFDAYCKRHGVEVSSLRFAIHGEQLHEGDTPRTRNINEGDEIDVMQEQVGGC